MIRIAGKVSRYIDASMNRATPTKLSAGAHDAEQQSAWPGARREARVARGAHCEARASREGAHRNMRPDAPNKNYTIKHNTLIVNKRKTIRFVLLQCFALYAAQ